MAIPVENHKIFSPHPMYFVPPVMGVLLRIGYWRTEAKKL